MWEAQAGHSPFADGFGPGVGSEDVEAARSAFRDMG
jgi:hypothetical protein